MKPCKRLIQVVIISFFAAVGPVSGDGIVVTEGSSKTQAWLQQRQLNVTETPKEAMQSGYILVAGQGLPKRASSSEGQRKLTALRAAEVMAYRRLAEILNGVSVVGQTTVYDCSLESDVVNAAVKGYVKGARKVYEEWNSEEGIAVVLMQVGMRGSDGVAEMMLSNYMNTPASQPMLRTVAYKPSVERSVTASKVAAPASKPVEHDGLVIDATELAFRPALINRIFSKRDEALYDPTRVSQKVLVEQGAGEYSNSVEKARAALEIRGTRQPLVIKAVALKTPGDLYVSDEDAIEIFAADQKGNFLASAKVAFVLK